MAGSGKSVDPIFIGIIAVGLVGVVAFWFLGDGQKPSALPSPAQPDLTASQAPKMEGTAAMWGPISGEQSGASMAGGGGMSPSGPSAPGGLTLKSGMGGSGAAKAAGPMAQ